MPADASLVAALSVDERVSIVTTQCIKSRNCDEALVMGQAKTTKLALLRGGVRSSRKPQFKKESELYGPPPPDIGGGGRRSLCVPSEIWELPGSDHTTDPSRAVRVERFSFELAEGATIDLPVVSISNSFPCALTFNVMVHWHRVYFYDNCGYQSFQDTPTVTWKAVGDCSEHVIEHELTNPPEAAVPDTPLIVTADGTAPIPPEVDIPVVEENQTLPPGKRHIKPATGQTWRILMNPFIDAFIPDIDAYEWVAGPKAPAGDAYFCVPWYMYYDILKQRRLAEPNQGANPPGRSRAKVFSYRNGMMTSVQANDALRLTLAPYQFGGRDASGKK